MEHRLVIHYGSTPRSWISTVKAVPVGAGRRMVMKGLQELPNMSHPQDMGDLRATGAGLSESEAEPEGEHSW